MNGESMNPTRHISAFAGDLVHFANVGIFVSAGFNEDDNERPFVSIDTSGMKPEFTYDEKTGLRGDALPFVVQSTGDDDFQVVKTWADEGEVVASFPPTPTGRLDANAYAKTRNESWHEGVGMPIISVHLNDGAEIYDDNGEGNQGHVWLPKAKLDALEEIAAKAHDSKVSREELGDQVSFILEQLEN